MQDNQMNSLYAHAFVTLAWNLFARSNSVARLMYHHFEWREDSMLVTLPKHKGDQEGSQVSPKHVYANPVYPEMCPLLSLAVYAFSCNHFEKSKASRKKTVANEEQKEDWCLFKGTNIETKFSHWLRRVLNKNLPELEELTSMKDDLGTHSFRKGVVTYVLSFPCGPSVVAAFLRAGWSLGAVQQRYIFEGEGSDQFLGRVACGLPFGENQFQSLPPHFDPSFTISSEDWKKIYPPYAREGLPQGFKDCLPYLLASLVHHSSWLKENLLPSHPLFKSPVWTSKFVATAKPHVLSGIKRCDKTHMVATGVPPLIDLRTDIAELKELIDLLKGAYQEGTSSLKNHIGEVMSELPTDVGNYLYENFNVKEARGVNIEQLHRVRDEIKADLIGELRAVLKERDATSSNAVTAPIVEPPAIQQCWHFYDGKYHCVPAGFKFETMSLDNLWNLWHYGNLSREESPYKFMVARFDITDPKQRCVFSKASSTMKLVMEAIVDSSKNDNEDRTSRACFERGLHHIIDVIEKNMQASGRKVNVNRRYGELCFTTLYNDRKWYLTVIDESVNDI
jgi:hypothetical protein